MNSTFRPYWRDVEPFARPSRRGSPAEKAGRRLGLLLLTLSLFVCQCIDAFAQRPSEYQVKAAFLYNFPNFVEWPAQALPDSATTLVIGILGKDPFGDSFSPFIGRKIKGREVQIRRSTRLQELPVCQVLFICDSEKKYLPQILRHFAGRPVLTVGESEGFARDGVMINFVLQANKVKFEINVDATERAALKLSAKLLKLATIVEEERE